MLDSDTGILLIEDDRVDIMTVQRAFKKNDVSNPLHIARTGVDALGMLKGDEGHEKIDPPPGLILLDLNLPRMSGIEFLEKMRQDPELRALLEDAEVIAILRAGDTLALVNHPGIRQLASRVAATPNGD